MMPFFIERYCRLNEVLDCTGLSRATLYRKIQAGTFPPQYKTAVRACGWRLSEVSMWLDHPETFHVSELEALKNADGTPVSKSDY